MVQEEWTEHIQQPNIPTPCQHLSLVLSSVLGQLHCRAHGEVLLVTGHNSLMCTYYYYYSTYSVNHSTTPVNYYVSKLTTGRSIPRPAPSFTGTCSLSNQLIPTNAGVIGHLTQCRSLRHINHAISWCTSGCTTVKSWRRYVAEHRGKSLSLDFHLLLMV